MKTFKCKDCGSDTFTDVSPHNPYGNDYGPYVVRCGGCGAEWEGRYVRVLGVDLARPGGDKSVEALGTVREGVVTITDVREISSPARGVERRVCDCHSYCTSRNTDRGGIVRAECLGLPQPPQREGA
jgi:hypothetical protein